MSLKRLDQTVTGTDSHRTSQRRPEKRGVAKAWLPLLHRTAVCLSSLSVLVQACSLLTTVVESALEKMVDYAGRVNLSL